MKGANTDRAIELGHQVFVPVTIDAKREVDGVDMFRATYLIVTTEAPSSVWEIELPPLAQLHGLGALGMLGVVFSTMRTAEETGREVARFDLFADPDDVASIFALEDEGELSINLEDVWLPAEWCADAPEWMTAARPSFEPISRGDVFRISVELFRQAYRYATGDIGVEDLLAEDFTGRVLRSPRETAAFEYWADRQIDLSKDAFELAPDDVKLRWV